MNEVKEVEPMTKGIPPAARGALHVLQQATDSRAGDNAAYDAAWEVATYHAPSEDQAQRHRILSRALQEFLAALVDAAPPGPERSTAISRAREAKFWGSAAIALEGK